jgi:hypothetical protein
MNEFLIEVVRGYDHLHNQKNKFCHVTDKHVREHTYSITVLAYSLAFMSLLNFETSGKVYWA